MNVAVNITLNVSVISLVGIISVSVECYSLIVFKRKEASLMYGIVKICITENRYPALYEYCADMTSRYKNLKNASLFILRQWYTSFGKTSLQPNQIEVANLVQDTCRSTGTTVVVITHNQAISAMADRIITVKSGTISGVRKNESIKDVSDIEW